MEQVNISSASDISSLASNFNVLDLTSGQLDESIKSSDSELNNSLLNTTQVSVIEIPVEKDNCDIDNFSVEGSSNGSQITSESLKTDDAEPNDSSLNTTQVSVIEIPVEKDNCDVDNLSDEDSSSDSQDTSESVKTEDSKSETSTDDTTQVYDLVDNEESIEDYLSEAESSTNSNRLLDCVKTDEEDSSNDAPSKKDNPDEVTCLIDTDDFTDCLPTVNSACGSPKGVTTHMSAGTNDEPESVNLDCFKTDEEDSSNDASIKEVNPVGATCLIDTEDFIEGPSASSACRSPKGVTMRMPGGTIDEPESINAQTDKITKEVRLLEPSKEAIVTRIPRLTSDTPRRKPRILRLDTPVRRSARLASKKQPALFSNNQPKEHSC